LLPLVYNELRRLGAHMMGISLSTAERLCAYARAWLFRALRQGLRPIA
jgi:hypothetical protein